MGTFNDLTVRVTRYNRQPLHRARVTASRDGQILSSVTTDERGNCRIERNDDRELALRVESPGLDPEERVVTAERPDRTELFMLGRPGMPFYCRGRVRVPFEPVLGAIGVAFRALEELEGDEAEAEARASRIAERLGVSVLSRHPNFGRSGIAIVGNVNDPNNAAAAEPDVDALLNRLFEEDEATGDLLGAGAIVQLFDEHASFLTNMLIVRFDESVEVDAVQEIASRFGLVDDGPISALGKVHRLISPRPASYALLDTCNALAAEPGVVYAEPDLFHTSEDDAVIPTDFLFPQQWDHPIIDTPNAWQELRNADVNRTFGSPDVIIAVVDRGVDATHPEFMGNVSNGQTKLYQVFDFADMVANMNTLDSDHGTACASAATANANNASTVVGVNEGISGVAGNCRLIGIRRGGTEARYAEIYLWAAGLDANSSTVGFPAQITPGADVITNSFGVSIGSPISGLMSDTFDTLTDDGRGGNGTLLFFSAGNDESDLDDTFDRPWGMYERCFCVAASTLADDGTTEIKAKYSSWGSTVDFCAPSDDNEGVHNPTTVFGAHAATIQASPAGNAIPGHPDRLTTLTTASAAGDSTLTLASVAGMAVGQAVLVGAPNAAGAEGRRIAAVNAGANQISIAPALMVAHAVGTAVAGGPRSYQTGFGGTSYATPVCAGTSALMLSAHPQLRWDEVRDIMRATAVKIDPNNADAIGRWRDGGGRISTDPAYQGPLVSEFFGFGRIDVEGAVRRAGWSIDLATPSIVFNDIPTGETTVRAIRFDVRSFFAAGFQITAGPGAPFTMPLGTSVVSAGTPDHETVREAILWIAYTGTAPGDTASGSVTVSNPETGRSWTLPISANTVERTTTCVMLCLDRSGSMDWPSGIGTAKRIDVLRFSAEVMVDVLHEGDGAGIVSFDHDPFDVLVPPVGPLGPVTVFDVARDQIRGQISTFTPNLAGGTAIGDGLERAQQRLAPVTGFDNKAVIVFTDGEETASKYITDVAASITDRTFAVALGRAENIKPAALDALTKGTGGYCVLTGDLGVDSRYKLAKYFLQVLAGVKNEDVVVDPDGYLRPGDVHEIPFDLTETDITTDVILMVPAKGSIDFTLVTPSGDVVDPSAALAAPGSLYHAGRNVEYYRLTLPLPIGPGAWEGRWTARLHIGRRVRGATTHLSSESRASSFDYGHGLPYSLLVHAYSNLRMDAMVTQSGFAPGCSMLLRATLTEYGLPVAGRATVVVQVTDPTGVTFKVPLVEASPGVFEATVAGAAVGTWEARFMARGRTLRRRRFTREAVRTGAVWLGGDREPPRTENGTGENPDPGAVLCHLVSCLVTGRVMDEKLRERLRESGLNIDALAKCISVACSHDQEEATP